MHKLFLFLIFPILFIFYCKEEVNQKSNIAKKMYVNSLQGASLSEKPELKNSVILVIPHGKEIETTEEFVTLNEDNKTFKVRKISFGGVSGYIREEFLSDKAENFYFMINSIHGLNIRVNPNSSSKLLKVIPYGYIGEFLTRVQDTDDERIYWIQVQYNGTVGWIHSGFTLIAKDLTSLEERIGYGSEAWFYRLYSDSEKHFLQEVRFSLEEEKPYIKKIEDVGNYKIYQIEYEDDTNCDAAKSKVIFFNQLTQKYYSRGRVFKETLREKNNPLANTVLTKSEICNCCCETEDSTLFFLLKDKIALIEFKNQNEKAECIFNGEKIGRAHV